VTIGVPDVELYVNGSWVNVSTYVRVSDGVVIVRGRQDEQGSLQASTVTLTLDNRDGRFSPRNPNGAYYGYIGRNTPIRVSKLGSVRFYGEVSAWPPRWALSQKDAWVTVQGAGITRRLTQGPKALRGPITRYVSTASNVIAYWPCEDGQGSSSIASGITSGTPMELPGPGQIRLAADSTFSTSAPLPVLNTAGLFGAPNSNTASDTFAAFLLSVPVAGDTNDTTLFRLLESNGSCRFEIRYFTASSGSLLLRCFDPVGGSLLTSASLTNLNGVPSVITLVLQQSGANVNYSLRADVFATGATQSTGGVVFGYTKTALSAVQVNADRAAVAMVVGHVMVATTDQTAAFVAAMRGYSGETAATRISRLCTEEAVSVVIVGTAATSEPMGSQTAMTLMDLLAQCEATDGGFLYEPRDSLSLAYRTRNSMYAAAADMTLPYTNMDTLEPVDDDFSTRNDVTVSRIGGSSANYEVTTGRMSTSAPPTGAGRYDVEFSVSASTDTRLLALAEWRAHLGTLDEPRYPVIGADIGLLAAGALRTAAMTVDVGSYLTVTGPPVWGPRSSLRALIIGSTETFVISHWRMDFTCAQGSIWSSPFTLDSSTLGRLDSSTAVLNGAHTSTTTTLNYLPSGAWVTTAANPADFPFTISVGGEDMTVTAGTATTLTVTRSVNGVVKAQTTGTEIHLAQQNRIML
jgi:hypothetical protein